MARRGLPAPRLREILPAVLLALPAPSSCPVHVAFPGCVPDPRTSQLLQDRRVDTSETRLHIVIVGRFRQIDDRSFRRFRWLGWTEMCLLARGAASGIGNIEITIANAEVGLCILWQRRAAVDRRRPRMQIDH